jgi:hypothetical protein
MLSLAGLFQQNKLILKLINEFILFSLFFRTEFSKFLSRSFKLCCLFGFFHPGGGSTIEKAQRKHMNLHHDTSFLPGKFPRVGHCPLFNFIAYTLRNLEVYLTIIMMVIHNSQLAYQAKNQQIAQRDPMKYQGYLTTPSTPALMGQDSMSYSDPMHKDYSIISFAHPRLVQVAGINTPPPPRDPRTVEIPSRNERRRKERKRESKIQWLVYKFES